MSRTPEDLSAPPNERPPHINPRWWYRATWHARQQAINAHNQQQRRLHTLRTTVETAHTIHQWTYHRDQLDRHPDTIARLLDAGITPTEIAEGFLLTISGLEVHLRRAGRPELSRIFNRIRQQGTCADCNAPTWTGARCKSCAARVRELARWAKERGAA